ncbi:uncharacterized protein LOC106167978 [Lingula anatina]|uniref:Uncharacterized protein LOC106167978 n=1 Tax=Lingula anatina TaxID=7574 RepID=A0A1S3IWA8_LINAN|nr:uncharacterized protein LOC106167978 [Lingula anatina]|eukprot:XP_013402348.2 uncharacterized protein LOC106167978 [Lingula anatina]
MASEPVLRCSECNMMFKSRTLLAKHRSKFCVGGVIGDPRQLMRMRTAEEEKRPKQHVEERPQSDGFLSSQKVQELQDLKNRRSRLRASQYLEEKMLLGDLEYLERHQLSPKLSQLQPSTELRDLQREYAVLREKENKLKEDINQLESPRNHLRDAHQRQIRLLAEDHGKQLADIKARNSDLERQKEDIRRRLEELGRKNNIRPQAPQVDMTQKLISELKAQEDKNQKTLQELKRQLSEIHKSGYSPRGQGNKFQPVNIPYYGNSLMAEIGAMRQAYLQSGGNDPAVLAQMADMQAEAQALEEQNSRSREASKPKTKPNVLCFLCTRGVLTPGESKTLGFQVGHVKGADQGLAKVRLAAYHIHSGKIVQSVTGPVTCSTSSVGADFKYKYHVFGQQEAIFQGVNIQPDIVIIARVYLSKNDLQRRRTGDDDDDSHFDESTLVAWGAVPLVVTSGRRSDMYSSYHRSNINQSTVNTGTHTVLLYEPPVPETDTFSLEMGWKPQGVRRFRRATLRLRLFHGKPRPGSLTPSEASDQEDDTLPKNAWLPCKRSSPPSEPYNQDQGFDIYIDACKNMPDGVTFSKVAGRILSRDAGSFFGADVDAAIKITSDDIYNPVYNYRLEMRDPNISPTATLLLKIYTRERFVEDHPLVNAYAVLNIFVESGTETQPEDDNTDAQISLNEGAHQLRLYFSGPQAGEPITGSCLHDTAAGYISGATILVRLVSAALDSNGQPLEIDQVPQTDWEGLGLWVPAPAYSSRVYLSMSCEPGPQEVSILQVLAQRTPITAQKSIELVAEQRELRNLRTEDSIANFITEQLIKPPGVQPSDMHPAYVVPYSPKHGIKVCVDGAVNLPWTNFTHAQICLNPPGAFYKGNPHAAYDKPVFTEKLMLTSTNKNPQWEDGFMHFPSRHLHRHMCVVIHIQEIAVNISKDSYKYGLMEQAWTALPVFSDGYVNFDQYKLPLFRGAPSAALLKQLTKEPVWEWTPKAVANKSVKYLEGASVFAFICDTRREQEMKERMNTMDPLEDLLPSDRLAEYESRGEGRELNTMVPHGKTPQQFVEGLAQKFKSLVYKLYSDGGQIS